MQRTRSKAEMLASEFGVPAVYDDPEELLRRESIDFVDIITRADAHSEPVDLAVNYHVPLICQKPMANDLETAQKMVEVCQAAGSPFVIHETWRLQYPLREVKRALCRDEASRPLLRAHIAYASSAPVFDNHPYLKELDHSILSVMGSHIPSTWHAFYSVKPGRCTVT